MNNNEELQPLCMPEANQVSSEQEIYSLTTNYNNKLAIINGCFSAIKIFLGCALIFAFVSQFDYRIELTSFQFDTEYEVSIYTFLTLGLDSLGYRDPVSVAQSTSTLGLFGVVSLVGFILYYITQFLTERRDMISTSILLVLSCIIGFGTISGVGLFFSLLAIGTEIFVLIKLPELKKLKSELLELGVVVEEPVQKFNIKAWIAPTLIFIVVLTLTILASSVDISKFAPGYNINQVIDIVVDQMGGRTNTTTKYQFQMHNYIFNIKVCWAIVCALSSLVFLGFNNINNKVYNLFVKLIGLIFAFVTLGMVTYLIMYAFGGQGILIGIILIVVDLLIISAIILTIISMIKILKSGNMKQLFKEAFVG